MVTIIQCISAFIACIGFSLIFRIHQKKSFLITSSLGGALGWLIYVISNNNLKNELIAYFIAMSIVSLFAELSARIFKAPATIFLIIGCFPLVPGRGIYQTMLYCTQGNTSLFLDSFIHTIAISASLALSIMIVSTIFKVIKKFSIRSSFRGDL